MKTLLIVLSLLVLSGCETLELRSVSVGVSSGHYNHGYVNYGLGYYSGHHYHGYPVYGDYGHRYYYAPRTFQHHRRYARPHHYVQPQPRQHRPRQHRPRQHSNRQNERRHDNRRNDRRDDRGNHKRDRQHRK